jgi:hypothetical protein
MSRANATAPEQTPNLAILATTRPPREWLDRCSMSRHGSLANVAPVDGPAPSPRWEGAGAGPVTFVAASLRTGRGPAKANRSRSFRPRAATERVTLTSFLV